MVDMGRTNNIKAVLKTKDEQQINAQSTGLYAMVLFLANSYTSAKFSDPLTADEKGIVNVCVELICNQYANLSVLEIKLAFEMMAANQFDFNTSVYYGKFNAVFLGGVLTAYVGFRNKIVASIVELETIEASKKDVSEIERLNKQAQESVISTYQELKKTYESSLEIDRSLILPFWGKILVDAGLIKFSIEQKKEIFAEARQLAKVALIKERDDSTDPIKRRTLTLMHELINNLGKDEDFESRVLNQYCKLIVIKSIIN